MNGILIVLLNQRARMGAQVPGGLVMVDDSPVKIDDAFVIATLTLLDGLITYWKLDEASGQRNDSIGTHHLDDHANVGQAAGKLGQAADFEAAEGHYLTTADAPDLSFANVPFTIGGWFKTPLSSGQQVLMSKYESAAFNTKEYAIYRENQTMNFTACDDQGDFQILAQSGISDADNWHFVCAWYDADSDTYNLQIDNGTIASAARTRLLSDSPALFAIGAFGNNQLRWEGQIDAVFIYGRDLSADERAALFNDGDGLEYPFA